ncbi:hypothetical protein HF394_02535 [Planococcus glaciei]|uniref:Uncharacterized protein n=1 Tax=Planococcus glaciei TaxID=459472 RepID=A0A7H8Q6H2_9BACL|nr:hypothetical protein [Planococcus glaciei]QDY44828.1 hypothetical protein FK545_02775 [Planococcus glaciei]QKX49546.1 hypothetical protein HF394_02535 [Planococcus glaciei]
MKKVVTVGIMAVLVCSIFGNNRPVSAANASGFDYADYAPGVTVEADAASPTGYYATFVYEDETSAATKVELYSDTFHHFTIEDGIENPYKPEAYKRGH